MGGEKILTDTYMNNLVLLAGKIEEIKSIIAKLEAYMDRKKLKVNVDKTKVIRFKQKGEVELEMWKNEEVNEGSEEEEGKGDRGEGKRVVEKDNLWEDLVEREKEKIGRVKGGM